MESTGKRDFPRLFKSLRSLQFQESGAAEKTRTSTHVTGQRPQRCASTNSATAALEERASYQSFDRL